ncbi:MAG: glycosyltransferase family 4 protein, partial [Candidatus Omnitrophica bacterium]|nr:glycosyltransferase family 4 protein [Candidatus Omnitrophota bacterium]
LLDKFLASLSTKIIVVSQAVNRRFSWMKNRETKVKTIYNGINLEEFDPSTDGKIIRMEFGLNSDTPLVGTVGRLDWYKGYPYLLEAARKVVDNVPRCRFLIVGDGEKRKELEDLTNKLNLNDNVIFAGSRNDIPEILASLDLFVLSSVSEGLGRSIIEAMAMQKAVVATNIGGIPEVVKHSVSGILVPAKNADAFAEAIIDLIKNKDKALKMAIAGRKLAETKFNLNFNVEKIQNLYFDLFNSDRKDGRA